MDRIALLRQIAIFICYDFVCDYAILSCERLEECDTESIRSYINMEVAFCLERRECGCLPYARLKCNTKHDTDTVRKIITKGFLSEMIARMY